MFSGVPAVSTRDAKGPGDCRSGVSVAEEVGRVGDKGSGDTTVVNVEDTHGDHSEHWHFFSSTAKVSWVSGQSASG